MRPIEIDWVEEWLADQERSSRARRPAAAARNAISLEQVEEMFDALDPVKVKPRKTEEPTKPVEPAKPVAVVEAAPLSSVDELYEAFKRLEQQLGTISDSLQTYTPHS